MTKLLKILVVIVIATVFTCPNRGFCNPCHNPEPVTNPQIQNPKGAEDVYVITGTVSRSIHGDYLAGVDVCVQGQKIVTKTDGKGQYKIAIPKRLVTSTKIQIVFSKVLDYHSRKMYVALNRNNIQKNARLWSKGLNLYMEFGIGRIINPRSCRRWRKKIKYPPEPWA